METFTNPFNSQIKTLLDEANQILKDEMDLRNKKEKLGSLLEEVMQWNNEENKIGDFYNQFSEMISCMQNLDFSKKLTPGKPKSIQNLLALGLNMLNEDLQEKVFPLQMVHAIIEAIDLKNTLVLVTDNRGTITFIHTDIIKPHFSNEALQGQNISVIFHNFNAIDYRIKKEGILKSLKVNMHYDKTGEVTLRVAMPGLINNFNGIAYVITLPDKL
jgi:hypothetical protein